MQPGAGQDHQTRSVTTVLSCFVLYLVMSYLLFILLSVSFQSTTPRCSLWETVSSKHISSQHNKSCSCVESSCFITMTSSYVIQPTGPQDRKAGSLNVSLDFVF